MPPITPSELIHEILQDPTFQRTSSGTALSRAMDRSVNYAYRLLSGRESPDIADLRKRLIGAADRIPALEPFRCKIETLAAQPPFVEDKIDSLHRGSLRGRKHGAIMVPLDSLRDALNAIQGSGNSFYSEKTGRKLATNDIARAIPRGSPVDRSRISNYRTNVHLKTINHRSFSDVIEAYAKLRPEFALPIEHEDRMRDALKQALDASQAKSPSRG